MADVGSGSAQLSCPPSQRPTKQPAPSDPRYCASAQPYLDRHFHRDVRPLARGKSRDLKMPSVPTAWPASSTRRVARSSTSGGLATRPSAAGRPCALLLSRRTIPSAPHGPVLALARSLLYCSPGSTAEAPSASRCGSGGLRQRASRPRRPRSLGPDRGRRHSSSDSLYLRLNRDRKSSDRVT